MRVASLAAISALAACTRYYPPAPAAPREGTAVAASFGRTWDAVIDEFAAKNIPIRTLERASGFIATEALRVTPELVVIARRVQDARADCGYLSSGVPAIAPSDATYNIVVRGDSTRSLVRVTVKWMHIGRGDQPDYPCETMGTYETALEEGIRARAEASTSASRRPSLPRAPEPQRSTAPSTNATTTTAARLNVMLRMRFVDPDSTVTPIPDIPVSIISERGDTTDVRTNTLGVATFALPPGRYRAVPARRADFDGRRHEWDVAFAVRMGMGPVDLTQRNAKVTAIPR